MTRNNSQNFTLNCTLNVNYNFKGYDSCYEGYLDVFMYYIVVRIKKE